MNRKSLRQGMSFIPPLIIGTAGRVVSRKSYLYKTKSALLDTSSKPRVVVLPGMDGSELMLNNFRNAICSNNDLKRVIGVHYPRDEELSVPDLADFVTTEYLTPLRNDPRGYVVVSQSFSGHVGMNLAHKPAPGIMIGQVFVNAFVSPPGPSWIQNGRLRLPSNFFQRQPPPWMVSSMFLGAGGSGMDIVQAAGAKVAPHVMRQRLDICLAHDSWATWRCTDTLPGNRTLYIRGDADAIVANDAAEQMRKARPDIFWESVPDGPHLLLQRFGRPAARSVHKFCERLSSL